MKKKTLSILLFTLLLNNNCVQAITWDSDLYIHQLKESINNNNIISKELLFDDKNYIKEKETKILKENEIERQEKAKKLKQQKEIYRKDNVHFDVDDITSISGINYNEMRQVLNKKCHGALAPYSDYFVDAEREYKINAFFLAGIVAQESGWGKSEKACNQNNFTGFCVYDNLSRGSSFCSPEENIIETARLLKEHYLNPKGKWFHGYSIWDVNTSYCYYLDKSGPNYKWSKDISLIANSLVNIYHDKIK